MLFKPAMSVLSFSGTIAIFRGRPDHAGVLTRLRNVIRQVENKELSHEELLENLNDAAEVLECIYINEVGNEQIKTHIGPS